MKRHRSSLSLLTCDLHVGDVGKILNQTLVDIADSIKLFLRYHMCLQHMLNVAETLALNARAVILNANEQFIFSKASGQTDMQWIACLLASMDLFIITSR